MSEAQKDMEYEQYRVREARRMRLERATQKKKLEMVRRGQMGGKTHIGKKKDADGGG